MNKNKAYEVFMYFFGCVLPIVVNLYCFDFKISNLNVILVITISCFAFYFLCEKIGKKKCVIALILLLCVACMITFEDIKIGVMQIYNSIVHEYSTSLRVSFEKFNLTSYTSTEINTATFIVFYYLSLFTILLQMLSLVINKSHFFTFVVTLFISFPVLIVQIKLNWVCMIFLYVYWIFLLLPSTITTLKIQVRQMILLGLSAVLCMNFVLFNLSENEFRIKYSPDIIQNTIIDQVNQVIRYFSTLQYQNSDVDLNLATNRYYANIVHLKVQREKNESLYLKTYAGAIYKDNKWKILPLSAYENQSSLYWQPEWIRSYEINDNTIEKIVVEDVRKGSPYSALPYYIRDIGQDYKINFDYSYRLNSLNEPTVYQVWKVNSMSSFQEHMNEYPRFIKNHYNNVSANIQNIVDELGLKPIYQMKNDFISANYSINQDDFSFNQDYIRYVTSYIRSILKQYTYTLKPGVTPAGEDFVDYFLTQNRKGYCVHFASAATLMFRYYGIPARYVEGYYVKGDAFDSNGNADVFDYDAHAWVEIFDLDKGWCPIEVTVGSQQPNPLPIDPNPTPEPEPTPDPNKPDIPIPQPEPTPDDPEVDYPDIPQNVNPTFKISDYYLPLTVALIVGIYLIVRYSILKYRKHQFTQENRQQCLYEIYRYLEKVRGVDCLSQEMISIFEKNKFSQHKITEDEYQLIFNQTNEIVHQLYKESSFIHKLKMKYIRFWI